MDLNNVKFCKDCRHCFVEAHAEYAKCIQPQIMEEYTRNEMAAHPEYLVTGDLQKPYCSSMRNLSSALCGQEGKLWEPIPRPDPLP